MSKWKNMTETTLHANLGADAHGQKVAIEVGPGEVLDLPDNLDYITDSHFSAGQLVAEAEAEAQAKAEAEAAEAEAQAKAKTKAKE